jgi:hypothetical protein
MKKLEVGEKYLSIKIIGHDYIPAYPNKDKKNENEPDFKGDGVAVWVKKKKAEVIKLNEII